MTWEDRAACVDYPQDWWFPLPTEGAAKAKAVCRACPVRFDCLQHALDNHERFGVWGGYAPKERATLRRYGYVRPA